MKVCEFFFFFDNRRTNNVHALGEMEIKQTDVKF